MESIYTYENNFLKTERDSKNRFFEYNINILNGLLNSITNEYNEIESFVYDNDNNITEIRKSKNDESRYIQVVYQKFNKIPLIYKILLQNGAIYEYAYDVYDQLVSIDYYNINNVIEKRRLVTYTYYNDGVYSNGRVKTIKLFNDLYTRHYEYDKFYNVIRIYYTAYMTGGNIVTKEYNDNGNLVKEIRGNQNNIVNYLYDELNRIKNMTNSLGTSFDYTYDEYNKLVSKKSNVLNKVSYAQYQNRNLSNINPSNAIATDLQMLPDYYCNFFNNYSDNGDILLALVNQSVKDNTVINSYKQFSFIENYCRPSIFLIDNVRCFNLNSTSISPLIYKLNDLRIDFNMQTICFWFNATDDINGKTIFYTDKSAEDLDNNVIRVYFLNNKIHAKIYPDITSSDDSVEEISIDENIEQFKWYFVSISWMSRQDDPTSPDVFEFRITLNDKFAYFEKSNPRFYFTQRENQEFFIGGEYLLQYNFVGYIGPIVFQNTSYLTDGRLLELYYSTKPCVLNTRQNKTVEALALYENSSSSNQLFPLNSTLNSLNNIKPYYFENREGFKYDINKNFSYNPITQRYAYLADGAILQYDLDPSNSGPSSTGTIRFKILIQEDHFKQYIVQYKTRNNILISIYRNNDKKLVYEYKIDGNESTKIVTNIFVQTNKIIDFRFIYYQASELYSNVSIYVDSIVWHHTTSPLMLQGGIITIGRSVNIELNVNSNGVFYSSNNPLFGLVEHLEYGFDINAELSMWNVKNYSNEYNAFGLLVQENNSCNDNLELVKKYKYVEEFIDGKYKVSSLVKEEEFSFNNSTITYKYSYDLLGRIIKISTDNKYVTYDYNFDGSLFKENHYIEEENAGILQNTFIYEYDENSNITKINQIDSSSNYSTLNNYTYDSSYPDRVSSIGMNTFKYDSINHLYPISFGTFDSSGNQLTGFRFTWNDGLLSSVAINGNTFYYTYEHSKKLKLTKRINNSITYFYYDDNDLLIKEVSDDIIKEYIYDINLNIKEILITKNNIIYRYIYLRDILGNIVGLLDEELNQVASYEYYAFGRIKSQSTTVTSPFNLIQENPFKYRGYYYDSSIYMYLCKNRYYMSEYGRWLSPDSPNYLEPNDINGMNLYCYCYNNPISYVDIEGNDAILVIEHGGEGLPIVGHALLLFQTNDNWYLTEFRNGIGGSGLKTCISLEELCGKDDDPFKYVDRLKTENNIIYKLLDFLNLGGYDYIRLEGDYSGCLKLAEKYNDPTNTKYNNNYNLFTNNCLHYVHELLKKGYNTNPTVQKFIVNSEEFVPIAFLNNIEEKQKIKKHIRVYVPVIQN